jgi:hypothetical protein
VVDRSDDSVMADPASAQFVVTDNLFLTWRGSGGIFQLGFHKKLNLEFFVNGIFILKPN